MKKNILKVLSFVVIVGLVLNFGLIGITHAEGEESGEAKNNNEKIGTSISLSPVSNVLQISSNSSYKDTFEIKNDGEESIDIEVYAAPYSYAYSEEEDVYKLGFSRENDFTQIVRWISLKDTGGSWVEKANYTIAPGDTLTVQYKITTPDNIPAGGQYAVIFAHTLTAVASLNGVKTEASPGLIIYGHSTEGEAIVSAEISDMRIDNKILGQNGESDGKDGYHAAAKVKNNGNVDFSATGTLKIDPIIGGGGYETSGARAVISVIPDSELVVSDDWENLPAFGIYRLIWTVRAGEETQTIEKIVFINPLPMIIIAILVLTIGTVWTIIVVRKRKERRSRLAV